MSGTEIIFEVSEDELDGGYSASALGFGIHTQGDTMDELRRNAREAVDLLLRRRHRVAAPDSVALREGRGSGGVKVPRDVSGAVLVATLRRMGYEKGAAAGLARVRHDADGGRTSRGHPVARSYQGEDAVKHTEEHPGITESAWRNSCGSSPCGNPMWQKLSARRDWGATGIGVWSRFGGRSIGQSSVGTC